MFTIMIKLVVQRAGGLHPGPVRHPDAQPGLERGAAGRPLVVVPSTTNTAAPQSKRRNALMCGARVAQAVMLEKKQRVGPRVGE